MPFYVVSVGEKENQNHKIRENGYIAYQIAWYEGQRRPNP